MEKIINNIEPYNKCFLYNCFYQDSMVAYLHFGVKEELIIYNNMPIYTVKDGMPDIKYFSMIDSKQMQKLTGIKVTKISKVEVADEVIELAIKCIDENKLVILTLDSFYLKDKEDSFNKIHVSHCILVHGYDTEKKVFYDVDFVYGGNYTYTKRHIDFEDVINGLKGFEKHLRKNDESKIIFIYEKKNDVQACLQEANLIDFTKKYDGYIKKYSKAIQVSEKSCEKLFSSGENFLIGNARKISAGFSKIKWIKNAQKYQWLKLINNNDLAKILDEISETYTFIASLFFKFSIVKKINAQSFENIKSRLLRVWELEREVVKYYGKYKKEVFAAAELF